MSSFEERELYWKDVVRHMSVLVWGKRCNSSLLMRKLPPCSSLESLSLPPMPDSFQSSTFPLFFKTFPFSQDDMLLACLFFLFFPSAFVGRILSQVS
jgi:hypothetical protein